MRTTLMLLALVGGLWALGWAVLSLIRSMNDSHLEPKPWRRRQ